MGNKNNNLSWDAFQALGNPDNAPDLPSEDEGIDADARVRVCLEKKHRGGKTAVVVRGLEEESDELLTAYSKDLKKLCGVGGSAKGGEIIIQGNQREKIQKYLIDKGYTDVKLSGG